MLTVLYVFLVLVIAASMLWRFASKYWLIPWPHWLAFWLENPYMKLFASPKMTIQLLDIKPNESILEIGCGAGRITNIIAQKIKPNGKVLAFDYQTQMIRKAIKIAEEHKIENIKYLTDRFSVNLLGGKKFDRIIMVTVLGEIPEKAELLQTLHKALKPNGIVQIVEVLPDPCWLSKKQITKLSKQSHLRLSKSIGNIIIQCHTLTIGSSQVFARTLRR